MLVINSLLRIKIRQYYLGGNGTAVRVDVCFPTCKNAASSQIAVLLHQPISITSRPPLTATKCNSLGDQFSPSTPAQTWHHAKPHYVWVTAPKIAARKLPHLRKESCQQELRGQRMSFPLRVEQHLWFWCDNTPGCARTVLAYICCPCYEYLQQLLSPSNVSSDENLYKDPFIMAFLKNLIELALFSPKQIQSQLKIPATPFWLGQEHSEER